MAWVKIRVPRTSQPQDACGIDWGNPITNGLFFSSAHELLAETGTIFRPTQSGIARAYSGSQYSSKDYADTQLPNEGATLFAVAYVTTTASVSTFLSVGNPAANFEYYQLGINSGGTVRAAARNVSGTYQAANTSAVVPLNKVVCAAAVYNSITDRVAYLDGVPGATNTASSLTPIGIRKFNIGALARQTVADFCKGGVLLALVFDRALSPEEIKSLSDNPWQIFEPEELTIWIPDSAATNTDNLTPKNITLSGLTVSTPTIVQTHVLAKKDINLSSVTVSSGSIQQVHQLTPKDITTGSLTISKPIIAYEPVVVDLTGKNVNLSALTIDSTTVGQVHLLTPQVVNLGSVVISKPALTSASTIDNLTARSITLEALQVTKPSIEQIHLLTGLDVSLDELSIKKSAIGQVHVLQIQPITLSQVVISKPELASLANTDVLYPKDITLGALSVSNPAVTQVHTLLVKSLVTGSVSVVNPIFRQVHGLTPKDINLGSWKITKPTLIIGGITEVYVDEILSDVVDDKVIVLLQDEVIQVNILSETI